MRKLILYGCIALSAGIGVIVGASESWGLAVFFGLRFALGGLALGGLLSFLWGELVNREPAEEEHEHDEEREPLVTPIRDGSGNSPEEMDENLWAGPGYHPIANPEYLEDMRRSDEQIRQAMDDKGLPPTLDPDDPSPGR